MHAGEMHSYVEQVSFLPLYDGETRRAGGERRPNRLMVVGSGLAILACTALVLSAFTENGHDQATELGPKFVDWKKEDAGSDDMNLHLQVADALAKADGLAEKSLKPVPEDLLKEAQQAAEEQRAMPGVQVKKVEKPKLPASLEKMFQQAQAEQQVEKLAKEHSASGKAADDVQKKKAEVRKAATAKQQAESAAKEKATEKQDGMKLLKQVASGAPKEGEKQAAATAAPAAAAAHAAAAAPAAEARSAPAAAAAKK